MAADTTRLYDRACLFHEPAGLPAVEVTGVLSILQAQAPNMDFDFHSTYAGYSNIELLKIILQKESYQQEAIKAATDILATRTVTAEEKSEAENSVQHLALKAQMKKEVRENIVPYNSENVRKFLLPSERPASYYIKVFCIIYFLLWIYSTIRTFRLISPITEINFYLNIILVIQFGYLLMIYWLFRLDKKGWILLFIYTSFSCGSMLGSLYQWGSYLNPSTYTVQVVMYAGIFYFFNRKDVLKALQVSKNTRITTLTISGIILLISAIPKDGSLSYYFS
jgi:hypothetical protein